MSDDKKRLPWRCKNAQQARDKNTIYQSREWKELRLQKIRANPLCEECEKRGIVRSAHCVHHVHPIEDSATMEEMRKWAFMWQNLVSLCDECHARIHKERGKGTTQLRRERAAARQARWMDGLKRRFATTDDDEKTPGTAV